MIMKIIFTVEFLPEVMIREIKSVTSSHALLDPSGVVGISRKRNLGLQSIPF